MSDTAFNELPLPEIQWTYRRAFAFGLSIAAIVGQAFIVWFLRKDAHALTVLGLAHCALIALAAVLYMAGAMATDFARIAGAVKVNLPGLPISLPGLSPAASSDTGAAA